MLLERKVEGGERWSGGGCRGGTEASSRRGAGQRDTSGEKTGFCSPVRNSAGGGLVVAYVGKIKEA